MTQQSTFIPFHKPSIGKEEIKEVEATLKSGWLTTGPRAARFEREFKEYVGAPHALAVNSATAGLHLALAGLKIGPGDEVITTPLTFCARSEEHTSELQSQSNLVCRLLLEKKKEIVDFFVDSLQRRNLYQLVDGL